MKFMSLIAFAATCASVTAQGAKYPSACGYTLVNDYGNSPPYKTMREWKLRCSIFQEKRKAILPVWRVAGPTLAMVGNGILFSV